MQRVNKADEDRILKQDMGRISREEYEVLIKNSTEICGMYWYAV